MSSYPFIATPEWREMFPGAIAATIAIRNVTNPVSNPALDDAKRALESELRLKWEGRTRADIKADPILAIYGEYYKRFGQNYHVQMQIESIALKGKSIPSRAALVEAMFMAELATGVLTAVHDLEQVVGSVTIDRTTGDEHYTRYDGVDETCKSGDMAMRDEIGILTSVIQGPTTHARATSETTSALFCLYAPAGIGEAIVRRHLDVIADYVRLIEPGAIVEEATILIG